MRLVVAEGPGVVSLNFMWLPAWLALNNVLKQQIEDGLGPILQKREMSDETLDEAHEWILCFFEQKFPAIENLRDCLDAVKYVRIQNGEGR